MTTKKASEKASEKTKSKVSRVLSQARESLRLLETLEKETLAKAKTFVKNPLPKNGKRLTNDKILASLKSLGVATRAEVEALNQKIEHLENEVATLNTMLAQTGAKRPKSTGANTQPSPDAFPPT